MQELFTKNFSRMCWMKKKLSSRFMEEFLLGIRHPLLQSKRCKFPSAKY